MMVLLKKTEALLEGHFELSSGLHSSVYLQCAKVLQFPDYAFKICAVLAKALKKEKIDVVIGAATGGIVISTLIGYHLKKRAIFAERKDERLFLRRGFEIFRGERVLIVEDVITTGGTVFELKELIEEKGAAASAVCALINRSEELEKIDGFEITSLLRIKIPAYKKENCPLCKKNMPISKPGSKDLIKK